ncbi:lipoprotein [Streptomyces tanashiensis]|nr:lipoprotein [Streptomyces tanashiensis]
MSAMTAFRRRYGASPLHLLLVLASFALAAYAGVRLLKGDTLGVALWFVGAALLHDLVLLPLYVVTDRAAQRLFREKAGVGEGAPRPSVNYVRVPVFVSGLLLLVWWPLILGRVDHYTAYTGLPADGFLGRWLLITAALFVASAATLLVRGWHESAPRRRAARRERRAREAAR